MPDDNGESSREQVADLNVTRSEHFRTLYADNIRLGFTPWDLRLTFGLITENNPREAVNEEQITIIMSPQHTKIVAKILQSNLERWERENGQINIAQDQLAAVKPSDTEDAEEPEP